MEPYSIGTLVRGGLWILVVIFVFTVIGIFTNGVRIEANGSGASISFGPTATPTLVPSPTPDTRLLGLVPWSVPRGMCDTEHGSHWIVTSTYPDGVCYGPPMDVPVSKGAPMTLFELIGSNIWPILIVVGIAAAIVFIFSPREPNQKGKNDWAEKVKNQPAGGGGGYPPPPHKPPVDWRKGN